MGPVLRRVFRAPLVLYRWHLGWILGRRFLLLEHRGRRTGAIRRTVLEVLRYDGHEAVVIAGFGRSADWYRNVTHDPHVGVEIGMTRYEATARTLAEGEGAAVLADYESRHRYARGVTRWVISKLVGWRYDGTEEQRRTVARQLPIVVLVRSM